MSVPGEVDPDHHNEGDLIERGHTENQPLHDDKELPRSAVVSLPDQDAVLQGLMPVTCLQNAVMLQRIETLAYPIPDAELTVSAVVVSPLEMPPRL